MTHANQTNLTTNLTSHGDDAKRLVPDSVVVHDVGQGFLVQIERMIALIVDFDNLNCLSSGSKATGFGRVAVLAGSCADDGLVDLHVRSLYFLRIDEANHTTSFTVSCFS